MRRGSELDTEKHELRSIVQWTDDTSRIFHEDAASVTRRSKAHHMFTLIRTLQASSGPEIIRSKHRTLDEVLTNICDGSSIKLSDSLLIEQV